MASHARERRGDPASIRGEGPFFDSTPAALPSGEGKKTRRRRMRDLLASRDDGFSLEEIQDILDIKRSTALDDLRHLQLSLRHQPENLYMLPPECTRCGYRFQMDEPRAPARCPLCKSEKVLDPVFKVGRAEA